MKDKKCDRAVPIEWRSLGPSEHHRSITKTSNGSIARNLLLNSCHLNLFSDRSCPSFSKKIKIIKLLLLILASFHRDSLSILLPGRDHLTKNPFHLSVFHNSLAAARVKAVPFPDSVSCILGLMSSCSALDLLL